MVLSEAPQPPRPASIGRATRPYRSQLVGVGALALVVVLALVGTFGTTHDEVTAEAASLRLDVTYPARFRYKTSDAVGVEVRNVGGESSADVTVRFDRGYVDGFSTATFTPGVARVTPDAYEVDLGPLAPGEARRVNAEVQAEAYWGTPGFVEAATSSGSVRVDVHSTVFP